MIRPKLVLVLAVVVWAAGSAPPATGEDKPVAVSAEDLTKAFEADEAAAKKKYNGKVIAVEGKVLKRTGFAEGLVTVVLAGREKKQVECVFAITEEKEVLALKPGDKVRIEGFSDGGWGGKNKDTVSINTCKLVK